MKSYGRWDSPWDMDRIRSMLEDAAGIARERETSLYICEDGNGEIVLIPPEEPDSPRLLVHRPHVLVCGITAPAEVSDYWREKHSQEEIDLEMRKEFWDNVEYPNYTIDEMVPRVHGFLTEGIIEYGHLGFLSEGEVQLLYMLRDATRLCRNHSEAFVAGETKKGGMMIAPVSEISRFIAPMACVVARSGFWRISDMHSDRIREVYPDSLYSKKSNVSMKEELFPSYQEAPTLMLYGAIGWGSKHYGRMDFDDWDGPVHWEYHHGYRLGGAGKDRDACILRLESAFEDAVRMPKRRSGACRVIIMNGGIFVESKRDSHRLPHAEYAVDPGEFLDGDTLLPRRITAAARDAYEEFAGAPTAKPDV